MGLPNSRGLRQSYVEANENLAYIVSDIAEAVRALDCKLVLDILFIYVIEKHCWVRLGALGLHQ